MSFVRAAPFLAMFFAACFQPVEDKTYLGGSKSLQPSAFDPDAASASEDAGAPDAGVPDAGIPDAGAALDSGTATDAGPRGDGGAGGYCAPCAGPADCAPGPDGATGLCLNTPTGMWCSWVCGPNWPNVSCAGLARCVQIYPSQDGYVCVPYDVTGCQ